METAIAQWEVLLRFGGTGVTYSAFENIAMHVFVCLPVCCSMHGISWPLTELGQVEHNTGM